MSVSFRNLFLVRHTHLIITEVSLTDNEFIRGTEIKDDSCPFVAISFRQIQLDSSALNIDESYNG